MRTCAVCGCHVKWDLCNECYKDWVKDGVYPEWLKEMIKMQSSFERKKANDEEPQSYEDFEIMGIRLAKRKGWKVRAYSGCE